MAILCASVLQDITSQADFVGLGSIRDMAGAEGRPENILVFLQSLVKVGQACTASASHARRAARIQT